MPQLPASACDGSHDAAGFARQPDQLIGVGFLATDEGFLHQLTLQADRCRLPHQTALKLTQRTADLTLVGTDQIAETTRTATPGKMSAASRRVPLEICFYPSSGTC